MSARRLLPLLVLLGALAVPAGAGAALGSVAFEGGSVVTSGARHRFVALQERGGHRELVLTAATARRYAGWAASWRCHVVADEGGLRFGPEPPVYVGGRLSLVAGARSGALGRGLDYCQVQLRRHEVRRRPGGLVVRRTRALHQTVALSPAGTAYVAVVRGAQRMVGFVGLVPGLASRTTGTLPATAAVVAKFRAEPVVALAGPDATPPAGRVGLWTDGAHRYCVVTTLADGTRLSYDRDTATRELHTNVQDELTLLATPSWWEDVDAGSTRYQGPVGR